MTHTHVAFVFSGQGSQSVGILAELAAGQPLVQQTFEEASAGARLGLWTLSQHRPEDVLNRTENTQSALPAASRAAPRCQPVRWT